MLNTKLLNSTLNAWCWEYQKIKLINIFSNYFSISAKLLVGLFFTITGSICLQLRKLYGKITNPFEYLRTNRKIVIKTLESP